MYYNAYNAYHLNTSTTWICMVYNLEQLRFKNAKNTGPFEVALTILIIKPFSETKLYNLLYLPLKKSFNVPKFKYKPEWNSKL